MAGQAIGAYQTSRSIGAYQPPLPTVYTDYIGAGAGADYATMAAWFAASGTGNVTYVNGDEVRAIFQTSADGHTGGHSLAHLISNGISFTEDEDITITFSSTNPTGSGTFDGWLTADPNNFGIQNLSSTKTWNFKDLDFLFDTSRRVSVNSAATSAATSPRTPLNFDRCKIIAPSAGNGYYLFRSGAYYDTQNPSGIIEFNFTNCLISTKFSLIYPMGGASSTNNTICTFVGCSILLPSLAGQALIWPLPSLSAPMELHMSGCIVDLGLSGTTNSLVYAYRYAANGGGYVSGTAVDYITSEPQSRFDNWATTQTNVSAEVSSVYGVAPAAGQVAFAGVTKAAGDPFDPYTRDLRLWDSTDNLAIDYVSNATLPSPDLAGQSRGVSPFNAGAFEAMVERPPIVFIDYIGSGTLDTSADYTTMATWYAASGTGNVAYANGDEVRAIFQTSADGHYIPHTFGNSQITNGICWTEDKDITITFSSTNPTGSGTPDGYLIGRSSAPPQSGWAKTISIQNAGSNKVWNFKDVDIDFQSGGLYINSSLSGAPTSSKTQVNFDRCKLWKGSFPIRAGVADDSVNASGLNEINFTNCLISPGNRRFVFVDGGASSTNKAIFNFVGCNLQSSGEQPGAAANWIWPNSSPSSVLELHMSGCIVDTAGEAELVYPWYGWGGESSGTAVDLITSETSAAVSVWATTQTNVSAAVSSVYGVAPAAGQVAFAGVTKAAGDPFDFFTRDLRLWDSTNNVASGFVSNVTLPSPDLAGQSRGVSPFNAGAFEVMFAPPSSMVIILLTSPVNLY